MNKNPLVSIIITCYNKAEFISDAIESALKQTYPNIECIIIDDGSTDESKIVANKYVGMDNRIRYYYKENGGPSSSRNYGVKKAKGEWIQFLDVDDWLCVDKIKNQLFFLDETLTNEDVVFYSDYVINGKNKNGSGQTERKIIYDMHPQLMLFSIILFDKTKKKRMIEHCFYFVPPMHRFMIRLRVKTSKGKS